MWIFTTSGFFSIVRKPGSDLLTVRARAKGDLEALRTAHLPELGPTQTNGGTDYPFRATVAPEAFAAALGKLALGITYPNFKDAVAKVQGPARSRAYHKVWAALLDLPEGKPAPAPRRHSAESPWPRANPMPKGKAVAYGGVVVDAAGRILLREPANHFGGYVWTFPKGHSNPGESPQDAALREVLEETGVQASIIEPIPGDFRGDTTITKFFLMRPLAEGIAPGPMDAETQAIRWVTFEEAAHLIRMTKSYSGIARDLAVLEAARTLLNR